MNIIGHRKNVYFLEKSIANNRLAHAYLFYGPKHIGKTRVAEYFISRLFCRNEKSPCGQCVSCQQILKRIHPDVFWLSGSLKKEKTGIEQVRQVQEFLFSSPFAASYKIAIIEGADNLTLQAANSFLKVLEEPPKRSIVILITRSFNDLLPTLRSRCQILRFSFPLKDEIITHLREYFSLNKKESSEILNLSLGQPGLAIEFARNAEKIKQKRELINQFISLLNENSAEDKFKLAGLIMDSETSPERGLDNLLIVARDLILTKLGIPPSNGFFEKQLKILSQKYSQKNLQAFIENILQTRLFLAANVNPKMAVENLLINSLN